MVYVRLHKYKFVYDNTILALEKTTLPTELLHKVLYDEVLLRHRKQPFPGDPGA